MTGDLGERDHVGPVLLASPRARAVIAAIREENEAVTVLDRGAYLRVLVPGRCRVTRAAIERQLGAPFSMPGDLEGILSSFKGVLELDAEGASWSLGRAGAPDAP